MKSVWIYVCACCISITVLSGQSLLQPYHQRTDYLLNPPGGLGVGLYGYANPALLSYLHQPDIAFMWSDEYGDWNDFNRWGALLAIPRMGFHFIHTDNNVGSVTDYNLSIAMGNRRHSIGFGYEWSHGDKDLFQRTNMIKAGYLMRPNRHLSLGVTGNFATSGDREGVVDLAFRPFGTELLTFCGDYALQSGQAVKDGPWSVGAVVELLPGVRITGRYFNDNSFTTGFNLSLGRAGISSQLHFDDNEQHSHNTYGVRVGAYDRTLLRTLSPKRYYVRLELTGRIKYQRYALFDKSQTLMSIISAIDAAKEDATVAGIALNLSGMRVDREVAWEIREALREFKHAGKHVVAYIDDIEMIGYHLASVADRVVIDPCGSITITGAMFGRMYLKGTLDKLGIGVDEWRFFKYKSAAEALSRSDMSDADQEQLQELADDYYALLREEIATSRSLSPTRFDELVDQGFIYIAKDAVDEGLVDTIGRWDAVKDAITSLEGETKSMTDPRTLGEFNLPPDDRWGERPQIALVYAIGVCDMEEGIAARSLVKDIEAVTENAHIKAVVFRVDSPGGDAIPSDIVAEALRKCSEKKPVIVSQGNVAGSGGYWLSMYGDVIVAAPHTITGSIGVIGLWLYDKSLKEKLGVSTDLVKAGEHADLGFGFPYPFLGMLPDRNLTDDERATIERVIKVLYHDFVGKVADGRDVEQNEIEKIAQGRVWSGTDAQTIGLVDTIGGIITAINIAKSKAGIPVEQKTTIIEYPKKGLIAPNALAPKLIGTDICDNDVTQLLKFFSANNGRALPILPFEYLETHGRY